MVDKALTLAQALASRVSHKFVASVYLTEEDMPATVKVPESGTLRPLATKTARWSVRVPLLEDDLEEQIRFLTERADALGEKMVAVSMLHPSYQYDRKFKYGRMNIDMNVTQEDADALYDIVVRYASL